MSTVFNTFQFWFIFHKLYPTSRRINNLELIESLVCWQLK